MENFDRKITEEPQHFGDKKDALIADFQKYLGIIKAVHEGADLQVPPSRTRMQHGQASCALRAVGARTSLLRSAASWLVENRCAGGRAGVLGAGWLRRWGVVRRCVGSCAWLCGELCGTVWGVVRRCEMGGAGFGRSGQGRERGGQGVPGLRPVAPAGLPHPAAHRERRGMPHRAGALPARQPVQPACLSSPPISAAMCCHVRCWPT